MYYGSAIEIAGGAVFVLGEVVLVVYPRDYMCLIAVAVRFSNVGICKAMDPYLKIPYSPVMPLLATPAHKSASAEHIEPVRFTYAL